MFTLDCENVLPSVVLPLSNTFIMCLSARPCICPCIHPSIHPFVYKPFSASIIEYHLFLVFACRSIYLFLSISICLSALPTICISFNHPHSLSICQSLILHNIILLSLRMPVRLSTRFPSLLLSSSQSLYLRLPLFFLSWSVSPPPSLLASTYLSFSRPLHHSQCRTSLVGTATRLINIKISQH